MRLTIKFICTVFLCLLTNSFSGCSSDSKGPDSNKEFIIFSDKLTSGFEIGVNSSSGNTGWLEDTGKEMKMSYPSGQEWGAVFITSGFITDFPRPSEDFSKFKTLSFEIRGENGNEKIQVGLKDKDDVNDGSETKITLCNLTTNWQTVTLPLNKFFTADISKLYIVIEFVFEGADARTIYFRNVKYLPNETQENNSLLDCNYAPELPDNNKEFVIFSNKLTLSFEIGIDSSLDNTGWIEDTGKGIKMSYPAGEKWGAVFIVAGYVADFLRPSEDFSKFKTLSFEIRGESGNERVQVGLKDKDDPDDGAETKITICNLTTEWQTVKIPLNRFFTSNLSSLYAVIEFIFEGADSQTVYFRNVKYLSDEFEESGTCKVKNEDEELSIYVGTELSEGYDIGLDSSDNVQNWLFDFNDYMKMEYSEDQSWGAVFITLGPSVDPPRPSKDLSGYATLSVELKGEIGGEEFQIGIKDNMDPDDGTETKIKVSGLTTEWQTYTFPLSDFIGADLSKIYVPIEFVFSGKDGQSIFFRNIKYINKITI